MIAGLDHIQLAMPPGGEEQARAFYSGVLGMEEMSKPEPLAARGGCWFQSGAAQIHLGIEEEFTPARKAHPALLVKNINHLGRALNGVGAVVSIDGDIPGRHIRIYTEDPFGNRIEFIQDGDGFSQR